MYINKIGQQHIEIGKNCQDYGLETDTIKLVCDGCSEGEHTEVGAKAFCHLTKRGFGINQTFKKLLDIFGESSSSVKNYLCFTILKMQQNLDEFEISFCGDGYIILQDINENIIFEELNDGEYPKYFAYNYVDSDLLKNYKDGIEIGLKKYSKKDFINVGIASDGLRFIVNADKLLKDEFIRLLKNKGEVKIKRFINKHQQLFKDDITIVF